MSAPVQGRFTLVVCSAHPDQVGVTIAARASAVGAVDRTRPLPWSARITA